MFQTSYIQLAFPFLGSDGPSLFPLFPLRSLGGGSIKSSSLFVDVLLLELTPLCGPLLLGGVVSTTCPPWILSVRLAAVRFFRHAVLALALAFPWAVPPLRMLRIVTILLAASSKTSAAVWYLAAGLLAICDRAELTAILALAFSARFFFLTNACSCCRWNPPPPGQPAQHGLGTLHGRFVGKQVRAGSYRMPLEQPIDSVLVVFPVAPFSQAGHGLGNACPLPRLV